MPFRAVVGHHHVVELLSRAIARDSLPPSLILSGPEGVGKRRVALALAQVLNCTEVRKSESREDPRTFVDACGQCAACRRIERGSFPDVLQVGIEGDATVIKVEQVRAVLAVVGFRPYEGRRRVVIIDPADGMDRFGQNALLKVLEETPAATVFALITSRPDALLPTIRSRCPQIRFGELTVGEVAEVLVRERGLSARDARAAASVSAGSVARAMEAASEDSTGARSQALALLQEAAAARTPQGVLEAMKAVFGMEKRGGSAPAVEREQVTLSLRALSSLLRDVAMLAAGRTGADLANADLEPDLGRVAASFDRPRVLRVFSAVDRALAALGNNANPKIVLDWLAYQM